MSVTLRNSNFPTCITISCGMSRGHVQSSCSCHTIVLKHSRLQNKAILWVPWMNALAVVDHNRIFTVLQLPLYAFIGRATSKSCYQDSKIPTPTIYIYILLLCWITLWQTKRMLHGINLIVKECFLPFGAIFLQINMEIKKIPHTRPTTLVGAPYLNPTPWSLNKH